MILLLGAQWPSSILPTTRMYPAEWYSQTKLNYAGILWYINNVARPKLNTLCVVGQLKLEPPKHRNKTQFVANDKMVVITICKTLRLNGNFFKLQLGTN